MYIFRVKVHEIRRIFVSKSCNRICTSPKGVPGVLLDPLGRVDDLRKPVLTLQRLLVSNEGRGDLYDFLTVLDQLWRPSGSRRDLKTVPRPSRDRPVTVPRPPELWKPSNGGLSSL